MDKHTHYYVQQVVEKEVEWCDDCVEIKKVNWREYCEQYPACVTKVVVPEKIIWKCLVCDQIEDTPPGFVVSNVMATSGSHGIS